MGSVITVTGAPGIQQTVRDNKFNISMWAEKGGMLFIVISLQHLPKCSESHLQYKMFFL